MDDGKTRVISQELEQCQRRDAPRDDIHRLAAGFFRVRYDPLHPCTLFHPETAGKRGMGLAQLSKTLEFFRCPLGQVKHQAISRQLKNYPGRRISQRRRPQRTQQQQADDTDHFQLHHNVSMEFIR